MTEQQAITCVPFYFDQAEVRAVKLDGEVHVVGPDVCKRLDLD
jgi:prophage antirepressor-like protein